MKYVIIVFLVLTSNLVRADNEYFYALRSGIILKIVIPDGIWRSRAIMLLDDQILIQEGVLIQLLPDNGEGEIQPQFEHLNELISFSLTDFFYSPQVVTEPAPEPVCYVAPMWEGPATFPLFNRAEYCMFSECNARFPSYRNAMRTQHHKRHLAHFTFDGTCPICQRKMKTENGLSIHLSTFHFKRFRP